MAFLRALLAGALCMLCFDAAAEALRYRVVGIEDELRDNVRAYLGDNPADEVAAERFLVTAQERTNRALEALGYYRAQIALDVARERSPWRVTVEVAPGEATRYTAVSAELAGPGAQDPVLAAAWKRDAPAVGEIVHHGRFESFRDRVLRAARERGFFDARFERRGVRVDVGAGTAVADLHFATGERAIFGAASAPEELISQELLAAIQPFATGDPYAQEKLLELRGALLRLGYFNAVVVTPELAARDGVTVPIRVDLQPAPRHSYEVGVGFSTDTRQRLSLVWSSPRLNRWGHSQQTRLRYSPINPALRTLYSIPLDDPATDLLQLGVRIEDNEFGDLDSVQRELLVQRETSVGTRVRSYSLRYLDESWDALSEEFDAAYVLAGLSYSDRTRRGNAVDPSRGFSQFYSIEAGAANAGSDQDLVRLSATLSGLRRLGERSRLVARVSAGILYSSSTRPDELPPSLAFFAGGDNSIRGYAYQSIGREISAEEVNARGRTLVVGGTRLLAGSLEYQYYLTDAWRVAAFVDAGDAFIESDFNVNVGVGVGVHYLTPLGAVRVEVADPVTEDEGDWRLHINIGAEL